MLLKVLPSQELTLRTSISAYRKSTAQVKLTPIFYAYVRERAVQTAAIRNHVSFTFAYSFCVIFGVSKQCEKYESHDEIFFVA